MRQITAETARAIDEPGSSDSAAAMVMISMPPNANATASRPAATPDIPLGANGEKFDRPTALWPGSQPRMSRTPMTRKTTMTATLMNANQYSNSPKPRTAARLTTEKNTTHTRPGIHPGTSNHRPMNAPAPVISAPMTMTSMNQYNQPRANPAQCPNAWRP